jgi:osmoprotectant transport system permease protein
MPRRITTVLASIVFTVPSLALFVVLPLIIPTRILDEANVIVALTLYTVALLVRAVPEALDAVPAQVRDAATAVGYRPVTRMLKVELPLALPVLIASLRVVAVTNISMVAVGSVIGIGGLGTWFTEGYQADKSDQIVAGIIAIFVLAIVIDTLIMVLGRLLTPWTRGGGARVNFLHQALTYIFTAANWAGPSGLTARILEHLMYTLVAVVFSALVAVPLGMLIGHTRRGTFLVVTGVNALRACRRSGCCSSVCCWGLVVPPTVALMLLGIPPLLAAPTRASPTSTPTSWTPRAHGNDRAAESCCGSRRRWPCR